MLTVRAPAKLNLTLEVLAKRQDGYHEIRSVIQTINLCDVLYFHLSREIEYRCSYPNWIPEKSLVYRAVNRLQEFAGCSKGVTIEINKCIPLISGLGGDSSDAAAALLGLNRLWELCLSREELLVLARSLGSDVAFFLYGGTALIEGRGEIVTPLPPLPYMWVVLVVPFVERLPEKTKQMYARLKCSHFTDGYVTQRLVAELREGRRPSVLFNTFENVAFSEPSELKVYQDHFVKIGAGHVHLAGSGPALFALIEDKFKAEDLFIRCQQQGMESYLINTLPAEECTG